MQSPTSTHSHSTQSYVEIKSPFHQFRYFQPGRQFGIFIMNLGVVSCTGRAYTNFSYFFLILFNKLERTTTTPPFAINHPRRTNILLSDGAQFVNLVPPREMDTLSPGWRAHICHRLMEKRIDGGANFRILLAYILPYEKKEYGLISICRSHTRVLSEWHDNG